MSHAQADANHFWVKKSMVAIALNGKLTKALSYKQNYMH
jgi:hypothetical protein